MCAVQVNKQLGVPPGALAVLALSFELTKCGDNAGFLESVHKISRGEKAKLEKQDRRSLIDTEESRWRDRKR